jgi:hypothetical protein
MLCKCKKKAVQLEESIFPTYITYLIVFRTVDAAIASRCRGVECLPAYSLVTDGFLVGVEADVVLTFPFTVDIRPDQYCLE